MAMADDAAREPEGSPSAPGPIRPARSSSRGAARGDVLLALTTLPVQDPAAYARAMAETIARALDVDHADVLRVDAAGDALVSLGASAALAGDDGGRPMPERVAIGDGPPFAAVLRTGAPYRARDVRDDPTLPDAFARAGVRSLLAVPLVADGQRVGLVYLASRRVAAFDAEDQALLTIVAARVGLLVEHAELEQRRTAWERERAREQARREFLGIVSHELKTPVTVIKAYTEALRHRAARDGDAEGGRILERVEEQASRMLGLIDDLLDLQRLEAGWLALEEGRVDVAALAARVVEEMQATTAAHRLVVSADEPLVARADRRRIEQALVNLIDNAVKYSPEGGEITVTVRRAPGRERGAGEQAMVAVGDRGIGIAPEDLPRVFDRFYQAGGGRLHRGVRGLGVGLYIAREIVERHGGELWAESAVGAGSTFYLTLPLAASVGAATPAAPTTL